MNAKKGKRSSLKFKEIHSKSFLPKKYVNVCLSGVACCAEVERKFLLTFLL